MIYDNRYNDNIVLKREAFQNLLTNIKNYPIIDIDFVEEYELDNLHDNNVWKGFTNNTPCLKVTYGDERTTKGNAMFASIDQKKRLFYNQQALKQLQIELNNRNYEVIKLKQALENNYYFLEQEKEQLKRIQNKVEFITSNKEAYLQAVLSVLLFPYAREDNQDYLNFADIWEKDNNGGPLSKININFTYTQLPLKYKKNNETNIDETDEFNTKEIDVILTYSQIQNFGRLLSTLKSIKDSKIIKNGEEVFNFNENERQFIESFEDFIKAYNYLSLIDAFEKQGFTEEEIQNFQQENSTNNRLSQETLDIIRSKLQLIVEDENWDWQLNNAPDFQSMIDLYKNNIENIVNKIIGSNGNDGIINYNIRRIQNQLDNLTGDIYTGTYKIINLTNSNYLPNIYYIKDDNDHYIQAINNFDENKTYYKFVGSIKYYEWKIQLVQNDIETCQNEILNSPYGVNKTVYGYKYIKLGSNIYFSHNFDNVKVLSISKQNIHNSEEEEIFKNNSKIDQASGTFKININDQQFEVPIKGFSEKSSNKDIYIKTEMENDQGQKIGLGNINFLGNILGKGSIVTNTGHIYASQGSVAAASFLALKSSVDRNDNIAGFKYNGNKKVFETYDITGHAVRNGMYSTNVEDYELVTLPKTDIGQIYIESNRAYDDVSVYQAYADHTYLDWSNGRIYDNYDEFLQWYLPELAHHSQDILDPNQQIYITSIDSQNNNRLTWAQARAKEEVEINDKQQRSLHLQVRKTNNDNLNILYTNTLEDILEEENTKIEFNKEPAQRNQDKIIITIEDDNKVVIKSIDELENYSRKLKVFYPHDISDEELENCISTINNNLQDLGANDLEINIGKTTDNKFIITNFNSIKEFLDNKKQEIIQQSSDNTEPSDTEPSDTEPSDTEPSDTEPSDTDYLLNYITNTNIKLDECQNLLNQRNIFNEGPKKYNYPDDESLIGKWICLDFNTIDYNINLIEYNWNYYNIVDQDKENANIMGLDDTHLVFWLDTNKYTSEIEVLLTPSIDNNNDKIPTLFHIRYDGLVNSQQGEIGTYINDFKNIIPVIERPQFYIRIEPDTELIKFSTQQLYLTRKEKTATLKVNPNDNFIEAYRVNSSYNDTLALVGLRFQDANINGNANILGTTNIDKNLNVRGNLIISSNSDIQSIDIHGQANTSTIVPFFNKTYNLGNQQLKWKNVYSENGYFDNIYLNGSSIMNNIPSTYGETSQFWIGGGIQPPHWGNTLSGELYLSNPNGATGNISPTNSIPTANSGAVFQCAGAGYFGKNLSAQKVFNAVYNDYAEYRQTIKLAPGHVVVDNDDGSLICSKQRLQPGAQVISDTFGHAMGYTENCQTPLAVAGRVLVYPYQDKQNYHAGMAVCSAPGGTVDIMTREEIKNYPDCIIGIVSEIPNYEYWGTDNIKVDNRIWIKIK